MATALETIFSVACQRSDRHSTGTQRRSPERYGLRHGTPEFERAAQELQQEAQLLQSLRHDNIVTMRGVTSHLKSFRRRDTELTGCQ